jgi:hypothetical protein
MNHDIRAFSIVANGSKSTSRYSDSRRRQDLDSTLRHRSPFRWSFVLRLTVRSSLLVAG